MLNLQADLEAILHYYDLAEVAFKNEPRRIMRYLADAPVSRQSSQPS